MAKHFKDLLAKMAPEDRREVAAAAAKTAERIRAGKDRMSLRDLRGARDVTQEEVARALEIKQGAVSRLEARDDMYVKTLARYIAALGGAIEVRAVFPEGSIVVDGLAVPLPLRKEPQKALRKSPALRRRKAVEVP